MKTKHTPGPWITYNSVMPNPETKVGIYTGQAFICIADCREETTGNGSNTEANAKLIAAAPDLLEALQRFVAFADSQKIEYESAMVRQCKEAIKKATL